MRLVAGLDIGNSSTELIFAEAEPGAPIRPVAFRRAATAGRKGSPESLAGAARLLAGAERAAGRPADLVAVAELHPVDTAVVPIPAPDPDGAVVRIDAGLTPSGHGFAAGRHIPLSDVMSRRAGGPPPDPVIISVASDSDYSHAAAIFRELILTGWKVVAMVAAGDDAVLIGNRIGTDLPIVDEAAVAGLPAGIQIAVEVAPPGRALRVLTDPIAVASALAIPSSRLREVAASVRHLADLRAAAVVARDQFPGRTGQPARVPYGDREAAEEHSVDLRRIARTLIVRHGTLRCDQMVTASLSARPAADVAAELERLTGRPVRTAGPEAAAARLGALTTPGLGPDLSVAVCDIGGGTIDLVPPDPAAARIAAGGGELVTLAVAAMLGIGRQLAERVKRAPSVRVASPYLLEHENGERTFTDGPLAPELIGRLCVPWRAGLLAFDASLAGELTAAEWRPARLGVKESAIGRNIERRGGFGGAGGAPDVLLLCGGGALDDEVVRMTGSTPGSAGPVVGRADVLGRFGPRYAVAAGLALLATGFAPRPAA